MRSTAEGVDNLNRRAARPPTTLAALGIADMSVTDRHEIRRLEEAEASASKAMTGCRRAAEEDIGQLVDGEDSMLWPMRPIYGSGLAIAQAWR